MTEKKSNNKKKSIWQIYGERGGRPPKYKSAKELQKQIVEYFEHIETSDDLKPTITGLTLFLGFADRSSFYDMERDKRAGFSYTIKRARLMIENVYEQLLQHTTPTGAIFALKNMGWDDKQTIDQNITESKQVFKIGDQIIKFD